MTVRPDSDSWFNQRSYDCFISYRRSTGFFPAKMIRDRLNQLGISCFLDLDESSAGKFNIRLLDAIRQCKCFILVLTKGSLDECIDEQDWITKEVEIALDNDKIIIPVRFDDFTWPAHLEHELPESIRELEMTDSVAMTSDYFDAEISKLISFMNGAAKSELSEISPGDATVDYLYNSFQDVQSVESFDLMFHTGSRWIRSSQKLEFLAYLLENNIPVRILINSADCAQNVVGYTQNHPIQSATRIKLFQNKSVQQNILEWKEFSSQFPELLQVRVSDHLFFHRSCIIRIRNGVGNLIVKNYRYGDSAPERVRFDNLEIAMRKYCHEFDFVWNHLSRPVEEY